MWLGGEDQEIKLSYGGPIARVKGKSKVWSDGPHVGEEA
jgi:hypothetical protein